METKTCKICQLEKSINEFNWRNKKEGRRQSACKECTRQQVKSHYDRNRKYYLDKANKQNHKYLEKVKQWLLEYWEEHPCVDCGEKHPATLQFDHIKGKKVSEVSRMVRNKLSLDRIQAEIDKCEVRCANCHAKRTAIQFGWFTAPVA